MMNLAQFGQGAKSVFAAVAPLIGTALGGPFGGLAGTVLSKYLGSTDPKIMEAAITSGDPDILLKMKQADNEFQEHMKTLSISEEQLIYADKASARDREEVVKDWTPRIIAYLVIVLVLIAEGSMFFVGQPKNMDGVVLGRVLGTLDSALILVLGYYFGSSASSADKNATIADFASKK
jgi:hypothetical protein